MSWFSKKPQGPVSDIERIAAGSIHSLAIKADGTVWGAGNGCHALGVKGSGRWNVWQQAALSGVAIAGGDAHSLLLTRDGCLLATGWNQQGALGFGDPLRGHPDLVHEWVPTLTGVAAMSAGDNHSLAVKNDGTLWATGEATNGQLGVRATLGPSQFGWVQSLTDVVAVAAGARHSLALKSDRTVWVTGNNDCGQLGVGNPADAQGWVRTLTDVSVIAAGGSSSFAIRRDGSLWVAGSNDLGQLGLGNCRARKKWVQSTGDVLAVASGGCHTLVVKKDRSVWAAGANEDGQLGVTNEEPLPTFTVEDFGDIRAMETMRFVFADLGVRVEPSERPQEMVEGLNRALESPSFYDTWLEKKWVRQKQKKKADLPKAIADLAEATRHYRQTPSCDLGVEQRQLVAKLHRLILEETSPECPRFRKSVRWVHSLGEAIAVAAGRKHSLAIKAGGALVGTGGNRHGQLGTGEKDATNRLTWSDLSE